MFSSLWICTSFNNSAQCVSVFRVWKPHEFSYLSLTTRIYSRWKYFGTNRRRLWSLKKTGSSFMTNSRVVKKFFWGEILDDLWLQQWFPTFHKNAPAQLQQDESTFCCSTGMDTKIGRKGNRDEHKWSLPLWPQLNLSIFAHTRL